MHFFFLVSFSQFEITKFKKKITFHFVCMLCIDFSPFFKYIALERSIPIKKKELKKKEIIYVFCESSKVLSLLITLRFGVLIIPFEKQKYLCIEWILKYLFCVELNGIFHAQLQFYTSLSTKTKRETILLFFFFYFESIVHPFWERWFFVFNKKKTQTNNETKKNNAN